jgi:DNA-binding NarL/FixJ family response regulator
VPDAQATGGAGVKTRFVVVDDHPVFRYGLVSLVETEEQYEVVAQAGTVAEALAILEVQVPDLLLVDLSLGQGGTGLDLLSAVRDRFPLVRSLVVSIHNEAVYANRAKAAGARGYVMKQSPGPVLKAAIRAVLAGKLVFAQDKSGLVTPQGASPGPDPFALLSPRERDVLGLLGKGRGVNEIADLLGLSAKTIGVHQDHIKMRLGVANNYELRRFAIEWIASQ